VVAIAMGALRHGSAAEEAGDSPLQEATTPESRACGKAKGHAAAAGTTAGDVVTALKHPFVAPGNECHSNMWCMVNCMVICDARFP